MPRIVKLSATAPIKIEVREKPVFVCACGLSQAFPLCDGSHKKCPSAEPDPAKTYVYDDARQNVVGIHDPTP